MTIRSINTSGLPQGVLTPMGDLLFAASEQGIAKLDFSDFTGMYQDRARTIPYTAVEQPLGSFTGLNGVTATAPADVNRGVVSARVNLLPVKSEEITSGGSLLAFIAGSVVDRYGVAVRKAVPNTTNTVHLYPITVYKPAGKYRIRFEAKAGEYSFITYQGRSNEGGWKQATFNLGTGLVQNNNAAVSAVMSPLGDGWYLCEAVFENITNTPGLENDGIFIGSAAGNWQSFSGDDSSGLYFTRCEIVTEKEWHLPYQRVNTPTDYDTAGFPHYLAFNGTNTAYVTPSIDFTGTDKMTVWAGVTKLSDAARGIVLELSVNAGANSGVFQMEAPNYGLNEFFWGSKGTVLSTAISVASAPASRIVTGIGDISGDIASLRVNGVATTSTTDQGAGNYGNYPLYIGARAGTSLYFNGRLYSLIARGAQSSLSQIEATELYIKRKMRLP